MLEEEFPCIEKDESETDIEIFPIGDAMVSLERTDRCSF